MSFDIKAARKAGYSEKEITDYLSKDSDFDVKAARKAGYSEEEIISYLSKPPEKEEAPTLKGAASAYGSGLAGGVGGLPQDVASMTEAIPEPLRAVLPALNLINMTSKASGAKGTQELTQDIRGEQPQNALERILTESGQWGGQEGTLGTGLGGPIGAVAGTAHGSASGAMYGALKELGVDDSWALGLTTALTVSPIAARKLLARSGNKVPKEAKKVVEQAIKSHPAYEVDKFESGLSKPRAVDSKMSNLAKIDPERQKIVIQGLDKEASRLAQKSVEKHLPLSEKISQGFDFEGDFQKNFGELKKTAEKFNPTIDITPISKHMRSTYSSYKGIPSPHSDAVKIKNEIKKFMNNPQTEMGNLLKIYRSNNKKLKHIYETAHSTGKQKEYVDFLRDTNKAIAESFERTLPKESSWLKSFKENNENYSKYLNTKKSLGILDPLLKGKLTSSKVNAIASNPKIHKKLEMSMGKSGSEEIIRLAKDLEIARDSIKNIPKKKLTAFNSVFPIGLVIPYVNIPVGIAKGAQTARELYGYYLTKPGTRIALDDAAKALAKGDITAYETATKELKDVKA